MTPAPSSSITAARATARAARAVRDPPPTPVPFQQLLDAHGHDVHRFLIATVGAAAAEDCYQETWLSALRAYPRLREHSNLRAWVMRIAHNKAIDHLRAAKRRPTVPDEGAAERVAAPPACPPVDPLDGAGLWAHVAALPVKQRSAVALRFIVDADYGEIGGAMGISEDAARRNVHEGLKRLRRELEP